MPRARTAGGAPHLVLEAASGSRRQQEVTTAVLGAVRRALADPPADAPAPGGAYVLVRVDGAPFTAVSLPLPLSPVQVAEAVAGSEPYRGSPGSRARRAAPSGTPGPRLPSATVVVPTVVARVAELRRCLDSLALLDHPDAEVVVVDNRPHRPADDPLEALLRGRARVRSVHEPVPGISAARNTGLREARGEVVAFTDDDVRVDPGWLRAIARRFAEHPEEQAVTGLVLPEELVTAAQQRYEEHYGGFGGPRTFTPVSLHPARDRAGRVRRGLVDVRDGSGERVRTIAVYGVGAYGAGANVAFRAAELRARGGFDVALGTGTPARGGEDLAAFVRVLSDGGVLGYEPAAVVHHTHRREVADLERQLVGNGTGFTAMLTSLVVHDPGHLLTFSALAPAAGWAMARQTARRLRRRPSSGPPPAGGGPGPVDRRLVALELAGMLAGPFAYLRSWSAAARAVARG
ncbi:glycosyltransferase family 2 protein [Kineococcus indalonis]|uniref:glycosyltransferase family 2 protein n=1 Tax=Kineococcus indalonis TaxID=2696566 RepID=UPI001412AAFD|nr:glycosyltransferase [Kineococcus indalonis]NAZ86489.1 glycosyltransferase [Kineococcus indalonis]